MQGPGPAGVQARGARLGGFMFKTQVLWKFPPSCISVPRLLRFQDWHGPSGPLLALAKHLEAPASHSLRALFHEGGSGGVGAGIFPPKEPLTGTLLSQPLLLAHDALCKLSPLLSGRGAAQGERRSGASWGKAGDWP